MLLKTVGLLVKKKIFCCKYRNFGGCEYIFVHTKLSGTPYSSFLLFNITYKRQNKKYMKNKWKRLSLRSWIPPKMKSSGRQPLSSSFPVFQHVIRQIPKLLIACRYSERGKKRWRRRLERDVLN